MSAGNGRANARAVFLVDPTGAAYSGARPVYTVDPVTGAYVPASGGAGLTVREADGTPADSAVTEIVFPNNTLDLAGHVATYTPAGGSGTTIVGYAPFALPFGIDPRASLTTTTPLAANGGTDLAPIVVAAPLVLESLTIRNGDTTLVRSWEWRLYREPVGGGATLEEIAGANGSESFTAASASNRTVAATSVATLSPGIYWLAIRNTHATNTFANALSANAATGAGLGANGMQVQTLGSALGSTLNASTGWTRNANVVAARLNGRTFGESAAF